MPITSPTLRRAGAGAVAASLAVTAAVTFTAGGAAAAELPETFVDTASTTWSYSDDNTDPAAGASDRLVWTGADYDHSAWKTATGPFGAKRGQATGLGSSFPIATLLTQYIAGTTTDVPTFHFRTAFDVDAEQLGELSSLTATVTYDDALQVFLNGEKVAGFFDERVEQAPEAERNLTYAGTSNGDPVTSTFTIDADDLIEGSNTLAVALHQDRPDSSDIYFDFASLAPVRVGEEPPVAYTDLVLTIGSDESSRNVTWYTNTDSDQVLQYAKGDPAEPFPAEGATTVEASGGVTTSNEFNRRATITGLEESTRYVYRVGSDAEGWSEPRSFRTGTFSGAYEFLFFGDPQIGASGDAQRDGEGWAETLDIATAAHPDSELLFSAGDQVDHAANEQEYEYYLAPEQLTEIPTVPVNGNHDVGSKAYEQHYTVPNLDETAGAATSAGSSGGDYWFEYKDVLYVVINSNSSDYASHIAFMEEVVAEHGADAKWQVLAFHHSIYSVASHVYDTQIENLRDALPTAISDLGFDLVLQGHDHSYTRSYLVKNGELADASEVAGQSEVSAADGEVLYITANSASGSKYYNVKAPDAWFASVINQERVRNYSHISVTDDSITVKTLRSQANGDAAPVNSVVDEVTLVRDDVTAPEITFPEENEVAQGSEFDPLAGVTAADDRDGDVTASLQVSGEVDTATLGEYALVYTATDAAGNIAESTRTVTVVAAPVDVPGGDDADAGDDAAGDGAGDDAAGDGAGAGAGDGEGLAATGAELPLTVLGIALALLLAGGILVARRRLAATRG